MRSLLVFFFATLATVVSSTSIATSPTASGSKFGSVISRGRHRFDWDNVQYLYAFGDSYTFVQGTEGYANFR